MPAPEALQPEVYRVGEVIRNRDPLYHKDFNAMSNRQAFIHPRDYIHLYNAAARIIVECAHRLSQVPTNPAMSPRNYRHWLSIMLNVGIQDLCPQSPQLQEASVALETEKQPPMLDSTKD
jgi:hypothetical protein